MKSGLMFPLRWQFLRKIYHNSPLLKASLWYVVARMAVKALSVIGVFWFTRLLTPEQYGTAAIFLTWSGLLSLILTLNFDISIPGAKHDYDDTGYNDFVNSVLVLGLVLAGITFLAILVLPDAWLFRLFQLPKTLMLLIGVVVIVQVPYRTRMRIWQVDNQYHNRVITDVLGDTSIIVLSLILIILPPYIIPDYDPALGRILGMALTYTVIGLSFLSRFKINRLSCLTLSHWRIALKFAIPILPHIIASQLIAQSDRLMIDATIGRTEAGLYSFAYNIGSLVTWIYSGFIVAWIPWLFDKLANKQADVVQKRIIQVLMAFGAMVIALMIVTPIAVRWLVSPTYLEIVPIIPIIVASGFFYVLYGLLTTLAWYEKQTIYSTMGTVIAASVNVGLNILFISRLGYMVAGWTTLIAYLIAAIAVYKVTHRIPGFEAYLNHRLIIIIGIGIIFCATIMNVGFYLAG